VLNKKIILFVVNVDWFFISHRLVIAEAVIKRGYKVYVAAKNTGQKEIIEQKGIHFINLDITRSGLNPIKELKLVFSLYKIYSCIKPDIIHHITLKPVLYGSLVSKFFKSPKIVNAISGLGYNFTENRNGIASFIMIKLMQYGFNRKGLEFIFQNNDDFNDLFQKNVLTRRSHIHFIKGSGVDLNLFNHKYFSPTNVIKVLFPSRMLWDKGVYELYKSTIELKEKYINRIQFILVGSADSENRAGVSKEFMNNWQDGHYVKWLGYQKEMTSIYQDSHIVVLPSYREGLPKSLIEACAAGRAIITTNAIGCKECVEDGKNGIVIPLKNYVELSKAISFFVENPSQIANMGKYGRKKAENEFDIKLVIDKHLRIYEELI